MATATATLPATDAVPASDVSPQAQTRMRLLEAAACEFAEHGYHHATVREICKRAGANVAAVNYHFGDKEKLYAATLSFWIGAAIEQYPPLMGVPDDAPAVDRLRGFVRGTLHRMLQTGAAGWHGQLMAREMVEPTAAFDPVIHGSIKPMIDLLQTIVRDLAGPAVAEESVRAVSLSVIGQCCFYRHARGVITRMFGQGVYADQNIEAIADHVTRFTLAGLQAYASPVS
jgi:AcrR family transcriptional regulator